MSGESGCDTLIDQYAACMRLMEKTLPIREESGRGASPCWHLRQHLVLCVAEHHCPSTVDMVRLYCYSRHRDSKQCAIHMAEMETCLDHATGMSGG